MIQIVNQYGVPFEAASSGDRLRQWAASSLGPNQSLTHSLQTLRNRSRDADRNNPWIHQGTGRLVSHEVGTGVTLRSRATDEAFRTAANALWQVSISELDPEGVLNFGGLQTQLVRARRVAGEVFVRRRLRRISAERAVPLQVQVLEAEFVPVHYHEDRSNGHHIRSGIEYNRRGQRVAYWMHREHPQDDTVDFGQLIRVPARDVIHHYLPVRPGQRRGEPNAAQALVSARTFDDYEDAELIRKKTRAPFTGFITRDPLGPEDPGVDPLTGKPVEGGQLPPVTDVESGNILQGSPGEKLELFEGDRTGDGYAVYARSVLLKIAAGMGVPYEIMTGDWGAVNDRLVRAILNDFYRTIEPIQEHLLIHQVCRGIWHWWIDAAIWSGQLQARGYGNDKTPFQAFQARPHGWRYVHPEQDINAKIKAMENGLTSRQQIIDEQPGPPMEEIDRQRAEDPLSTIPD